MAEVTLKDVLDVTNRIEDNMSNRFDKVEKKINGIKACFTKEIAKTNKRVTAVEVWKTEVTAKVSTIVAGVTLVVNVGWFFIKDKFFNKK